MKKYETVRLVIMYCNADILTTSGELEWKTDVFEFFGDFS